MVLKPMSLAAMPAHSTCECRRSSSAMTTRMYCARGGGFEAGQLLHGLAERERVDERADAAHALHERDDLKVVARFGQVLDAAEVEADVQLGVFDRLAFADHVELVGFFKAGMVGAHGDLVAHFATSFCPCTPEAGSSCAGATRRFTPGLSPLRSSSGSYSRPVKSMAKPSCTSRSIQSAASHRSIDIRDAGLSIVLPAIWNGMPSRRPSRSQWYSSGNPHRREVRRR